MHPRWLGSSREKSLNKTAESGMNIAVQKIREA
jgi:hypothetical protein